MIFIVNKLLCLVILALLALGMPGGRISALAQEVREASDRLPEWSPGQAIVTGFPGAVDDGGQPVIDREGAVVHLVDIRNPGAAASGARLEELPARSLATAQEIGLVFGIAIDDAEPPGIYLAATAAFGLHLDPDGQGWMEGMWGRGGGPGSIWRLRGTNGHEPELFATIRLDGRDNTGAALGGIAFDPWHRQLYVSDLETGMIHRLDPETGAEAGLFDHGVDGRLLYLDAMTGVQSAGDARVFDVATGASRDDCPQGAFENTPECWNLAAPGRRVQALAVHRDPIEARARLYYAVAEEDDLNAVWSVAIAEGGDFDLVSVRREITLPPAPAGADTTITAISFEDHAQGPVMLVAERGAMRNLGLAARSPFAEPHVSRVLRLSRSAAGEWQIDGRFDVGFYDRAREGPPHIRANAAGGVATGFGYTADGRIDMERQGEFVWMTADALCSPDGPCIAQDGSRSDTGPANGLQGIPIEAVNELVPDAALRPYPLIGEPYAPEELLRSYLIDLETQARRDFSRMGAVAIIKPPVLVPAPVVADADAQPSPDMVGPAIPPELAQAPWWPPAPPVADRLTGPDLLLRKAAPPQTCIPGGECDFVIVATNAGTMPLAGTFRIADTLPAGWALSGFGPPGAGWACAQSAQDVVCDLAGVALPLGESLALTLRATVPSTAATGIVENCARIANAAAFADMNPANDSACISATVTSPPTGAGAVAAAGIDLSLTKSAPGALTATDPALPGLRICRPGEPCRFSIALRNDGPTPYQGPLQIVDTMPQGWSYLSADTGWICMLQMGGGPLVGCTNANVSLAPGQSLLMALTLRAPPAQTLAPAQNCTRLHWPAGGDADPSNDADCTTVTVVPHDAAVLAPTPLPMPLPTPGDAAALPPPSGFGIVSGPHGAAHDIAIDKSAPHAGQAQAAGAGAFHVCEAGQPCPFTVTLTNMGAERFAGPLRFTDEMPAGWSLASMEPGWSCVGAGGNRLSCSGQVQLEAGQARSLTLTLDPGSAPIAQPVALENCAVIDWTGAQADGNPANDRSCAPVMLAPAAAMVAAPPVISVPEEERADIRVWIRGPDFCEPGQNCEFLIGVEGLNDIGFTQPFTILDTLPSGWSFVSGGAADIWACQSLTDRINCLYDITKWPNRPAGGFTTSARFGTDIVLRVPANETRGTVRNCAILTFPPGVVPQITAPQYFACTDVAIARPSEVTLEKRFDEGPCVAGQPCGFSITVANVGKERYEGLVSLTDQTSPGPRTPLGLGSGLPPGWNCQLDAGREAIHCEGYLTLLPGDQNVLRFVVDSVPGRAPPYEVENCVTLQEYDALMPLDTAEDRLTMTRRFLNTQGYGLPVSLPLAELRAAIVDYKTNRADIRDASGARDLSPDVTDALMKHILPRKFDKALGGGKRLLACATTRFDGPALLIDKTPGVPANDPAAAAKGLCVIGQECSWTITVSGRDAAPFAEPVRIRDTLPENWYLVDFSPRGSWSCTSSGRIVDCAHPAANLSRTSAPLTLRLTARTASDPPGRFPEIRNCVEIRHATPAQAAAQPRPEWHVCQEQNLTRSDQSLAGFVATGSGRCTPPNCTFYEFAFTRLAFQNQSPLAITITPPPGSSFPAPAITEAPASCAVPGWSCRRSGSMADSAMICENRDCALSPGERVTLRIDGSVAPDLREPPPADIDKRACAIAAWEEEAAPSTGIEQNQPLARRLEACHTVVVAGRSAPAAIDLALRKSTTGDCPPGGSCRFRLTVENRSATPFRGPILLTDELSDTSVRYVGAGGGLACAQNGTRIACRTGIVEIPASGERIFAIDTILPATAQSGWVENCGTLHNLFSAETTPSRDTVRMLQFALNGAGYDAGPVDGIVGRRTRAAIAAARNALDLPGPDDRDAALLRRLVDPDGLTGPDPNPANDRSCVRIELPRPAPVTRPAPTTRPAPQVPQTAPRVVCENGVVRDGVCYCPAGWTRRQVGTNRYVCERPRGIAPSTPPAAPVAPAPAPVICIGGSVRGNDCICPSGWDRLSIMPGVYQCRPPTVQQRPAPLPSPQPAPQPVPQQPPRQPPQQPPQVMPQVMPQLMPTPPQFHMICPPGTQWVPEAGQCIRRID